MRTIDHAAFAAQFGKNVLKIEGPIKKLFFWAGNLMPDYSYHTYSKGIGHGFSTARKKLVQAWQSKHFGGESAVFYYRLGIAAHYICDSFTFPHNKQFSGNLSRHIRYENHLHELFRKGKVKEDKSAPVFSSHEKCMRYLESAHRSYIKLAEKSPLHDLVWITDACRTALLSSLKIPESRVVNVKRILGV